MPLVRAIFVFGLLALAGAIAVGTVRPTPDAAATSARFRDDPVRGMTVSCPRSGRIWATDATVESMRTLRDLGVTWVAIHPYGSISTDGTVGLPRDLGSGDDAWLTRPIAEAHALGLRIMVKPHLAYWHSRRFGWRGDIEFANDEAWDRFFTTYETWITTLATVCRDADLFVVGTELERTVQHESAWRTIIASVRARTGAPLTWAANWDGYTRVPFWDALDAVGVQAYFPLVTHEDVPRADELAASWARIIATLDAFGAAADRPVLLTEFGY
ncbi:MAG: hypothetical protein KDA25_10840, partial [Phycisphaerales bacterium]|nr:hypothetical protein [Phycisphaerales bacterium]